MRICSIEGCNNKHYARGYCNKHYLRWWVHKDPTFMLIELHGYRYHPLYNVWRGMKKRCYISNMKSYEYYGARGIKVCDEWRTSAKTFIGWCLNNGWKEGLYLDRRDNDGNYEPGNCRFVTPQQSTHNQRLLTSSNTSGYRGVSWNSNAKKWTAQIIINRKKVFLGYFDSPRLAAIRFDVEAFLTDDRPRNIIN